MKVTVGTKIRDEPWYPALDAVANHMAHVEHHLFVDRYVHKKPIGALKQEYIVRFGITARQFNSIASDLDGTVKASTCSMLRHLQKLDEKVARLSHQITKLQTRAQREKSVDRKQKLRQKIRGKKRHLCALQQRRSRIAKRLLNPVPRLCCGGGGMFRRQFHLEANGYRSHDEWLADWRTTRSSSSSVWGARTRPAETRPVRSFPEARCVCVFPLPWKGSTDGGF